MNIYIYIYTYAHYHLIVAQYTKDTLFDPYYIIFTPTTELMSTTIQSPGKRWEEQCCHVAGAKRSETICIDFARILR